jgi:hypothetical protein
MKRTFLVINAHSGSAAAVDDAEVKAALAAAGFDVVKQARIPDSDCPDRASVERADCDAIVVLSGDGTIASLNEQLRGWGGEMLVLPGGTMNLLSRRLHGEAALAELIAQLPGTRFEAAHIPILKVGEREVLTGLTVGPSTRWGEVREGIRHGDVSKLAEVVPEAWSQTVGDDGVWVEGRERQAYAGIFVEPHDEGMLSAIAFRANNIGDMLGHGVAWLRRDFREGPHDALGLMPAITVLGDQQESGLLIDGEQESGRLPLRCQPAMSSLRFVKVTA